MQVTLVVAVLIAVLRSTQSHLFYEQLPPLLVANPYYIEDALAAVPLVLMAQDRLHIVPASDAQIAGVSQNRPLVTIKGPEHEAMPAVEVELQRPLLISVPRVTVAFPAQFTVVHDGICMPIPVGAVIAPVPPGTFISRIQPFTVTVVYAIPTGPLPPQYPLVLPGFPFQKPNITTIQPPVTTPGRPASPPLVTVLDFPSSVDTPSVLVYQPITDPETELANRNPPQGVVPAGIIQSAAPTPNLSVFINSKESAVLQELRDEAERERLKAALRN